MSRACHKCKAIVPDNMLLCPVCVSMASDGATSAQQLKFLPMIKTGQGSFRLHRSGNQPKHIAMFDIVNYLAFCGAYLGQSRGGHAWTYASWADVMQPGLTSVCSDCLKVLHGMAEQLEAA